MVETRSVSSTGGEKGVKDERFDLIPVGPLAQLARHYAAGAAKYDEHQWRKGYEWSKSYSALIRHLTAFWSGEDIDGETGSHHMVAVAWHAFTLLEFVEKHPNFDDRYIPPSDVSGKPLPRDFVQYEVEQKIKSGFNNYCYLAVQPKASHSENKEALIREIEQNLGVALPVIGRNFVEYLYYLKYEAR